MADEGFKRKLAAILSADAVGYSRLMQDDEDQTIRTLTAYRTAITTLVQKFRGHVVDATGDNLLAEFSSVVDAVTCGVEIQRELAERNAELPDDRKMQFRIGINLGDVVKERGRIYGDGVNIAARMEGLAESGGICISGSVHDSVESRLGLGFEYLGEQEVKNIDKPVRVYRVASYPGAAAHRVVQAKEVLGRRWRNIGVVAVIVFVIIGGSAFWHYYLRRPDVEPASVEKMAYPLPEKPSIAVLPFDNMSGDPNQEFFSDGITEEIISSLSRTDQLFVIARNSTFTYKAKPVKVNQVSEELGVRYVLEGSVRKSDNRVRITVQLIDAATGHHLWSERYDREMKDIFTLQDEITMKIVNALRIKLVEGEQVRMQGKHYKNLDVLLKVMEANSLWNKGTKESLIGYGRMGKEIVDMAPEAPSGYITLATYNWALAMRGESPRESIAKAFEYAQKALTLDESSATSHAILGNVYLLMKNYEKAIDSGKRSVELEPNGALAHVCLGSTLGYAGRLDEAIGHLTQGIRLNPFPPAWYFLHLGRCYRQKGQYEEALTAYKKALHGSPDDLFSHASLASIYALLNRQEEANAAAKKVLEIDPNFSIKMFSKAWPYKNPADLKIFADSLQKAGLPYEPPLSLPYNPR